MQFSQVLLDAVFLSGKQLLPAAGLRTCVMVKVEATVKMTTTDLRSASTVIAQCLPLARLNNCAVYSYQTK